MADALTGQTGPFAGYSDDDSRPLGSYAVILAAFNAGVGGALAWTAASRGLPERIGTGDLALLGVATHKLSRLIAKDTVTSPLRAPFVEYHGGAGQNEVSESPRGRGPRRALGELIFCPPCVGQWTAAGLLLSFLNAPRPTRAVASLFAIQAVSDYLHVGFTAARDRA